MRAFVVLLVFWVASAQGQMPLALAGSEQNPAWVFKSGISKHERLEIEVVPIVVTDWSILEETEESLLARAAQTIRPRSLQTFAVVHEAMQALGLPFEVYNLSMGDHIHMLICDEANLYADQTCEHGELGVITDLPRFIVDYYDEEAPPRGTVQLNVVILEDRLAWRGVLGAALWWYWGGDVSVKHWTYRSCRAWALLSMQVIAVSGLPTPPSFG